MAEPSEYEFDQRLAELERDLGPVLRRLHTDPDVRPGPARAQPKLPTRPLLPFVGHRRWTAMAALLVGGAIVGLALVAARPQPANASEVLDKLQAEAITGMVAAPVPGCGPSPDKGASNSSDVFAFQASSPAGAPSGPTTLANAGDLSEKLATALGVSGEQVRAAMLATVRADLPTSLPPDPMAAIADRLGVSREAVCSAFLEGDGAITGFRVGAGLPKGDELLSSDAHVNVIDLGTVSADQLKVQAQRLGVSPDRLLAAVKAAVPPPQPLPRLPGPDEMIHRFAANLGLPEDKVRAAMVQVEGNNGFYFAVPLPGLSR
jgi:hypothetical protein